MKHIPCRAVGASKNQGGHHCQTYFGLYNPIPEFANGAPKVLKTQKTGWAIAHLAP